MEMIPITGTMDKRKKSVGRPRFVFKRKSPPTPPMLGRQFDLRGICLECGVKPDPLKPAECFCSDGLARARMREGANKKKRGL